MVTLQQKAVERLAVMFPEAVFYKPTQERLVALTIDDVPTPAEHPESSVGWILDAIATHNQSLSNPEKKTQATFFVIGSHLKGHHQLLATWLKQGHELGNHGFVDYWAALESPSAFEAQFIATHRCLTEQAPDHRIRWYRPGRAFYNQAMLQVLKRAQGYEPYCILASMLPLDTFSVTAKPRFTAQYVAQQIFPGAILVLHGGTPERARNTARALPLILDNLRSRGYRAVTLSELWSAGAPLP